jgi:hypothetical protein
LITSPRRVLVVAHPVGRQARRGHLAAAGEGGTTRSFLRHTSVIAGLYVALLDLGPTVEMKSDLVSRRGGLGAVVATGKPFKHLRPNAYVEVSLDVDGERA